MTKKWWSSYRAIKSQHRETQSCHPYKTPLLASSTTKTVRVWTYCENVGHVKTLPIPSTHRQLSHPVQTSSFRGILNLQCRETRFLWPQHVLLASSSSGLNLRLFSFLCSSNSMSSFMFSTRCCAQVVPKWASFPLNCSSRSIAVSYVKESLHKLQLQIHISINIYHWHRPT